jgi:hopanoid-associated phosphorylase
VAGLAFEARAAEQSGGVIAVYGQNRPKLVREIEALVQAGARGIFSFGTAGGLSPDFGPGDILIASSIITANAKLSTSPDWSKRMLQALPFARRADIACADAPVLTPADKSALWRATGAAAVDMESHLAGEIAARYGLPFAVLRAVIDPAHRAIPSSALAGMRDDGKTDAMAVATALMREPRQLGALVRLGRDARKAKRALLRSSKALGPFFGLLEVGEFALDMQ